MSRTPNTTCGTCGKPCYRSRPRPGSDWIPPHTHTCRDCRTANLIHGRPSTYKRRGCRCDLCREAWNAQCRQVQSAIRARCGKTVCTCVVCSIEFNPRANQITCSPTCRKAHLGRLGEHSSRAAYYGVSYVVIDRTSIFDRDRWTCGICELPVDPAAPFPEPGAATLDHIVPMSQGGGHVPENVQCAHFYCNTVKGARPELAC